MIPHSTGTLSVLFSELVLSLYPILIKTVQTNLFTQLFARFLVFPILAIVIGSTFDVQSIWKNPSEILTGILMSGLNLIHIFVSYVSFKSIPAGTALSLFYLYPIFNVIAGILLFNESFHPISIVLIVIACIGTYLIATSKEDDKKDTNYTIGVSAGILAALTETLIFIFVRSNKSAEVSPFYVVNHIYPFGLLLLLGYGAMNSHLFDLSSIHWAKLLGFNAVLGFTGYIARFYGMSHLPTIVFSLLSFIGITFGFMWDTLLMNHAPSIKTMVGGGLIAGSIAVLRYFL